ncbi:hypothetical protein FRC12_011195 [Ceratobasidium sp. 428]|nr:hypothetical protein FRC12_011195 [Ceratobasidium sp. 428]
MADTDKNAPANVAGSAVAPAPVTQEGPVPLSFPSILRNPNFAHLNVHSIQQRRNTAENVPTKKKADKDGKRRVRRQENSRFISNPHIVQPTRRDYAVPVAQVQSTFPVPLPPYLPRVSSAPSAQVPTSDPASNLAGKEAPDGTRLTHLLRPNPTRPDRAILATPPTTDWDTASATGLSAFATDASEVESLAGGDIDSVQGDDRDEVESSNIPTALRPAIPGYVPASEVGYEDEADMSGDDGWISLHESVASLSLAPDADPGTLRTGRPAAIRDLSRESSRSPSRRPHSRPKRRSVRPITRAQTAPMEGSVRSGSLWEYLFA